MMQEIDFFDIEIPNITYDRVAADYDKFNTAWNNATTVDQYLKVITDWDKLNRSITTWENLIYLHFEQETNNPEYKKMREHCDEMRPKLTELAVDLKRKFIDSNRRNDLERLLGQQAFALWEKDVVAFSPEMKDDLVQEAKLEAEYTNLLASAQLLFRRKKYNFSQLGKFRTDTDRDVRHQANIVNWQWFSDNKKTLDQIYDQQVKLRTKMAHKLGYSHFIELGYARMKRVDYTQADVEQFRQAVRNDVVPLANQLRQQQADALGIEKLMYWDEGVFDLEGNPVPKGDHDWMLERAAEMFADMSSHMANLFKLMTDTHLLDLKSRKNKAGGGFCTYFPNQGVPYIFANFNGTKGDVEVFTHEFGHAFQSYSSRTKPLSDYFFPTYESCEIHSMSLEFLTWPHMEKFFSDDAERFRRIHLMQSILFLPYGTAVDHFQHLVYANPEATPDERHAMWRQMEQMYLPWRDADGIPHVAQGGQWQMQRHIYSQPFYYIDYALALTCALQFLVRSRQDYEVTITTYIELCRRGGEASFQQLVRDAGIVTPFEPDCLKSVVKQTHEFLLR